MYLNLKQVSKRFATQGGLVTAVDGVDLQIGRGELVTLLGPSGCGKTTTLRMISGFEIPSQGDILLDGERITDLPPHERQMSMVFQSYAIFPHLKVFENVAYGLKVRRLPSQQIRKRVLEILELVGLTGFGDRSPHQISGGQQQRVALARALVIQPKVLLLDEPLSNLDTKLREQMRSEIQRIHQRTGVTSVYVTHDQTEAMTLSDRIVVMNRGRIEQIGTPFEIYRRPANRFVADFIGKANFLQATVHATASGSELLISGQAFPCAADAPAMPPDSVVTVVARPEMVMLMNGGGGRFEGVVQDAVYFGNRAEYVVDALGTRLLVEEYDPLRRDIRRQGEIVGIDLVAECLYLLPAEQ